MKTGLIFLLGILLGMVIEWVVWVYRCSKKNLFDKEGYLKDLNKKLTGESK